MAAGALQPDPPRRRHTANPRPYFAPKMNPAFFMPGTTTTQCALSIRSWGIPLSEALIMSVSASAEASNLSSTLISLSAAKAAVLMEPAINRTQEQCFRFVFIKNSPFLLSSWSQDSVLSWQLSLQTPAETDPRHFGSGPPIAVHARRRQLRP